MRKPLIATVGIAAAALLAAPVLAHHSDSPATQRGPLRLPVAAADENLPAFAGCDDLLDWYVTKALPEVGPYGFGWGIAELARDSFSGALSSAPVPQAGAKVPAENAVGSSETGTNVQEQGVDEPDFAKTDGSRIFRLQGRRLVVTDVSGAKPAHLGSIELPKKVYADQLLLVGDRVLVFGRTQGAYGVRPMGRVVNWADASSSVVLSYDVTDSAAPALVDRTTYDGTLIEARQYDTTVRLVLSNGLPQLDFVTPTRQRTEAQATRMNKQIVRESTIDDWLPSVLREGQREPLVDCTEVRHPKQATGFGTLSIVTFGADDPADRKAVAVTTDSQLAYSSTDHLYVAANDFAQIKLADTMPAPDAPDAPVSGPRPMPQRGSARIYAFDLTDGDTTYAGSGTVPGRIGDRWSLDEHDGYLRVVTHLDGNNGGSNLLTVLAPTDDGSLRRAGWVGNLGPREQLQSVRWFDDLAVLVTFRQIDPLYTVDLTDPSNPKKLGELKIPGFSAYLHPIGGGQLLGLGTSATDDGTSTGAQIATFDITDLTEPDQVGYLKLARDDYLTAADQPHAFTYLPNHRTMLTSVQDWNGHSRIIAVRVAPSGALTESGSYVSRYDVRMLPIDADRVALVGDVVRIVDLG